MYLGLKLETRAQSKDLDPVSVIAESENRSNTRGYEHTKKGTKLHFKSPTAESRNVLCVGVGGDRTHAVPL
jgi:hypothetical protein